MTDFNSDCPWLMVLLAYSGSMNLRNCTGTNWHGIEFSKRPRLIYQSVLMTFSFQAIPWPGALAWSRANPSQNTSGRTSGPRGSPLAQFNERCPGPRQTPPDPPNQKPIGQAADHVAAVRSTKLDRKEETNDQPALPTKVNHKLDPKTSWADFCISCKIPSVSNTKSYASDGISILFVSLIDLSSIDGSIWRKGWQFSV